VPVKITCEVKVVSLKITVAAEIAALGITY
jgi:hypothetical protein